MRGAVASIRDAIGRTPIVRMARLEEGFDHRLYGKCEFMNPGGSVKDRIGFELIERAEQSGQLGPGGTVVEATAGNTGMALAMAAVSKGYRLVVVMTTKMSPEKVKLMESLDAEVHIVPYGLPPDHPDALVNHAKRLASTIPGAFFVDQFSNKANFEAHYRSTGPEIWNQTHGEIDVLVCGIGTGGTLCGAGAFLKKRKPRVLLVLADPVGSILKDRSEGRPRTEPRPYFVEGIGGDFVPENARLDLLDVSYAIPDQASVRAAVSAFRKEGLFVGASSGCAIAAALRFCTERKGPPLNVLVMLSDGGRAYLSTIHDPDWRRTRGIEVQEMPRAVAARDASCMS